MGLIKSTLIWMIQQRLKILPSIKKISNIIKKNLSNSSLSIRLACFIADCNEIKKNGNNPKSWISAIKPEMGFFHQKSNQKKNKELFSHTMQNSSITLIRILARNFSDKYIRWLWNSLRISIRILVGECSCLFFDQNFSQKQKFYRIMQSFFSSRKYW